MSGQVTYIIYLKIFEQSQKNNQAFDDSAKYIRNNSVYLLLSYIWKYTLQKWFWLSDTFCWYPWLLTQLFLEDYR